jgi:integrase
MLVLHVERSVPAPEGCLFSTGDGRPLPPSTVNSWWQTTMRAAGTPGLHLHGLRHFYASGLIAAGCDVVTVHRAPVAVDDDDDDDETIDLGRTCRSSPLIRWLPSSLKSPESSSLRSGRR